VERRGVARGLTPKQVAALLASCDRRRALGRRDYAILVLLGRLGLRAAEVSALRLDDIDWRAGEIVVRGKGRTEERLPLPADVGAAIAGYLQRGRPRRAEREVFLRGCAPLRGLTPDGWVRWYGPPANGPGWEASVRIVFGTRRERRCCRPARRFPK
jgi:integrase/recombinase XerD